MISDHQAKPESITYPTELAWDVLVSLRLIQPYIVMFYLSPKTEEVDKQKISLKIL